MSKKNVIVVLFLFVTFCVYSQQNLKIYYSEVAKAETCFLKNKFAKANKHYRKAFKNKDFVFKGDLKNAVWCEIMSGKPSKEYCTQ
jgi:hypothetical protein